MAYSYECFAVTHIGNHRKNNEDSFYIGYLISFDEQSAMSQEENKSITKSVVSDGMENRIFAVSDGMGGHEFGEIASSIVVSALDEFLIRHNQKACHKRNEKFAYIQSFQEMIDQANKEINKSAIDENSTGNMGATLSGVIVFPDEVVPFNIGDSSTFIYEKGNLRKLTADDNEAEMIGSTSAKKLEADGKRLTKYFGLPESSGVLTATISKPVSLKLGQIFIIVTDGLTDSLSQGEITKIIDKNTNCIKAAVSKLLEEALIGVNRGRDNITVVMVKIKTTELRSWNQW